MPWPWSVSVSWILGFTTGALGATCLLCAILFRRYILPSLPKPLPRKRRPPPLPKKIIERVLQLDQSRDLNAAKDSGESAEWFNNIIDWLFGTMQPSPALRLGFFADSFADSVLDLRRTSLAYILQDATLASVVTGNSLPTITSLRILRWDGSGVEESDPPSLPLHLPESSTPFVMAMHLSYEGGVGASVRFDLVGGLLPPIWISERLMALEGDLYVCCLDKVIYYGFASPLERLRMDGEICIGNSRWPYLSHLMARYLFPWLFRRKWVMPAMKSKWLYDRPSIATADKSSDSGVHRQTEPSGQL